MFQVPILREITYIEIIIIKNNKLLFLPNIWQSWDKLMTYKEVYGLEWPIWQKLCLLGG